MAKVGPTNLPAYFANAADFEAWVTAIHNALTTLGFVQTSDTGQINPATAAAPTAGSQSIGYEIWHFNDAHQSDVPLYFKIEYGSGGASLHTPGLWMTVGSSSNGAGTLTGQVGTRYSLGQSADKTAGVTLPMMVCSDGSDLTLAVNYDSGNSQFLNFFHVTRPRDSSGAATADGAWTFITNPGTNGGNQFIPASGSIPANLTNSFPAVRPDYFSRSIVGADADVCPPLLPIGGNWRYSRLLVTGRTDFGVGGTFTSTVFGASHTFMSIGDVGAAYGVPVGNGSGNIGLAMPWE